RDLRDHGDRALHARVLRRPQERPLLGREGAGRGQQRRARHRHGRHDARTRDHRRVRDPLMSLRLVFVTVFVIAACGLGYELVAGALASYLLGDSITRFSIAIGTYLCALGIGAWLSKFLEDRL